jgi:uncharacterized protein with HEPN domain
MKPEATQRLREALAAAQLIARATEHQTLDGYLDDEWFQSAAERQLEIIGKAFTHGMRLDPSMAEVITDIRGWIGMRNILAHAYQEIKPNIIWDTIRQEIPLLSDELTAISTPKKPPVPGNSRDIPIAAPVRSHHKVLPVPIARPRTSIPLPALCQ